MRSGDREIEDTHTLRKTLHQKRWYSLTMNARDLLTSIKTLCEDIDLGRPLRRIPIKGVLLPLAVPLSLMGAAALPAGCGGVEEGDEICDNNVDDDGDGLIDCLDGDCTEAPNCVADLYGAPFV